jgi:release factor glutamine methyltransferase
VRCSFRANLRLFGAIVALPPGITEFETEKPLESSGMEAVVELGRVLMRSNYHFVTVTPATHLRVLERAPVIGRPTLRDIFGWNRRFSHDALPEGMVSLLREADCLVEEDGLLRSRIRFSSIGSRLYVHSEFPTTSREAVFFGPDTYRFCAFLERHVTHARRVVDIGCGSGAGGLSLADRAGEVVLADVSAPALSFARANAALAGEQAAFVKSDVLASVTGSMDLVVANPPYLRDDATRLYRDGGGEYGEALALRIVREALFRLDRGGRLLLYTGATIVQGSDTFLEAVRPLLDTAGARYTYTELDPDVFGDELEGIFYRRAERIAAVGLDVTVAG